MKLRHIFGCHGITLALPGPWQLEIWFCPRGSLISMHVHRHVESVLVFLGGRMWWSMGERRGRLFRWRDFGRAFRVGANVPHGAYTKGWFGLFANLERWHGPKTSAAIDLEHCESN